MVRANSKRKSDDMKKIKFLLLIFFSVFYLNKTVISAEIDIYKKIDLFGEVLEKINKEYVDEFNQSESMDSAINGLLQSFRPLFFSFSKTCSDKDWICLDEVPLAMIM